MTTTSAAENYIKAIYKLSGRERDEDLAVSTNDLAAEMGTKAASVTDMMRRLSEKGFIEYNKYRGVKLTDKGYELAVAVIRRHRLWEFFLVHKLRFRWDEVHDIADELEHVSSPELISRLDSFLGFPRIDPHGDIIPDAEGNMVPPPRVLLTELGVGKEGVVCGVGQDNAEFLQHLEKLGIGLGKRVKVEQVFNYDSSLLLNIIGVGRQMLSRNISEHIYVTP